ncbi:Serine/threonine-protein kinase 17B [Microtus ochrogaster]|uniref:Serine/threonine-protein kinase 17B n=1 Tax=Microtus ochrogaster TaxID=79684 RepID=A0A8J6GJP6_MICOH|nr:Serine/threonine-protein kinase 17B [Microtus ochrogaster]
MSRRRFDCRSVSGLLTTTPQTPMKTENFNNFYTLMSKELGRGKFAVVRQCISKSTGQEYAAKFLKKRRRGQDCRAEILHEIAVLELARACPHVINLHEVYETATEIILVLEYAAGGEIFNLCLPEVAEMVSENDVVRLIKQILEGVDYLHQNNIVHLDLKPQNILLSSIYPLGDIKIVDFGMSRKIGNACELREIMGTPEYLAPEILNYDPITTATDMWNIGVIAYMLLTHTSPFVGEDNQETYLNISQVNVDYSEETFSSVSQLATDFIQTLLVKNPEVVLSAPTAFSESSTFHQCHRLVAFGETLSVQTAAHDADSWEIGLSFRKRPTAESCLSHSWLQHWDFGSLFHPEETSGSSPVQDHTLRSSEDRTPKSSCIGSCGDREDKENIPEDSSMISKRFRFDDSLPSPHELVPDLLC